MPSEVKYPITLEQLLRLAMPYKGKKVSVQILSVV
jgi:hypothetical protein